MDLDSQRRTIQAVIDSKKDQISAMKAEHRKPFKESPDGETLRIPKRKRNSPEHKQTKKKKRGK